MSKTVPFQVIQFSISVQFSCIWLIDRTPSVTTTPDQDWPGSDGNDGLLCIPQIFSITEISPSDCTMSYKGHSLRGSYPSAKKHSVYLTLPTDWAKYNFSTIAKVTLATIVDGNPNAPFYSATTLSCRGGRYSLPLTVLFYPYPWSIPSKAQC